jgi:hypothetical protein
MPRQMTQPTGDQRLQRVLIALERELLQASDEEIRQAAGDLGIEPDMKGSIAWLGIFFPNVVKRPEEVFDMDALRQQFRGRLTPPDKAD